MLQELSLRSPQLLAKAESEDKVKDEQVKNQMKNVFGLLLKGFLNKGELK